MKECIKAFIDNYSYYANIIDIFDNKLIDIIRYLKKKYSNILISVPNTLQYSIKYKKTYYLNVKIINNYNLEIPLIVGSRYDKKVEIDKLKGYFIIDGKLKVIVNQEKRSYFNYCIIPKKNYKKYYSSHLKYNLEIYNNIIYVTDKDQKNKINLINIFYNEKLIKDNKFIENDYINNEDCILLNNSLLYYHKENIESIKNPNFTEEEKKLFVIAYINILHDNMFKYEDDIYFSENLTSGDIIFKIFEENIINKKK